MSTLTLRRVVPAQMMSEFAAGTASPTQFCAVVTLLSAPPPSQVKIAVITSGRRERDRRELELSMPLWTA